MIETKVTRERIEQCQDRYAQSLDMINIGQQRKAHVEQEATPSEVTAHRGIGGACNWLGTQTRPDLCMETSLVQGHNNGTLVKHLAQANKLLRAAHEFSDTALVITSIPLERLTWVAFGDAGWGVREDGSSQGGTIVIAADSELLQGKETNISIHEWSSYKLKRVCRSSLAAEAQAYAETLDRLEYCKVFWQCMVEPSTNINDVDMILRKQLRSAIITDCKCLYDALERSETAGLNLAEKRTAIEITAIKQRLGHGAIYTGWVNSDRQMADGFTKPAAAYKLLPIMSSGRWKIIWDKTFTSAKKIQAAKKQAAIKRNREQAKAAANVTINKTCS